MTNSQENIQSTNANSEMIQMLESSNTLKELFINMLNMVQANTLETNGKVDILSRKTKTNF